MCSLVLPSGLRRSFPQLPRSVPAGGSKGIPFQGCSLSGKGTKGMPHPNFWALVSSSLHSITAIPCGSRDKGPDPLLRLRSTMKGYLCSELPVGLGKSSGAAASQFSSFRLSYSLKDIAAQPFPGGAVVKNPPANAGDTGSSPGPGRSHMLWSN